MNQIRILHNLGEQKALLLIIERAPLLCIDIGNRRETGPGATSSVDTHEGIPGPILVFGISRDSIRVIETLDNLRPEIVEWVGNIKTVLLIERLILRVYTGGVPAELFGSDVSRCGGVSIMAPVDQLQSKVNVILPPKHLATKQEVSAIEARQMLGCIYERRVDVAG